MNSKLLAALALGALGLAAFAARSDAADKGALQIQLRFAPQESVASSAPVLSPGVTERPVRLTIDDARAGADPAIIGDSTDDDDRVWPVRATNSVIDWAREVLTKAAGEWGIRNAADAPLTLAGKLVRFTVNEGNKPVGSVYNANVQISFALKNDRGETLWEGNVPGDATRYGRSRSAENCNEVLSDALKEAYSALLAEPALQEAWLGKTAPKATAGPAVSPDDLLAELVKLQKQGFTAALLVDFVEQKTLSRALSADDVVAWKKAGMPEEVIKAALARVR